MRNRLTYAGFGVLSTVAGVAMGHLVAALTNPAASPVLAVGATVIDLTPTPLKEWAIAQFGTNDKAILIGSVLLGVLVLAAVAGLLALRRFAYGAALLLALVAVAAGAALTRPTAGPADLVPSLAAAVAGVAALWWLDRSHRAATPAPEPRRHHRRPARHPHHQPAQRPLRGRDPRRRGGGHGRRRALDHVVPHPSGRREAPRRR